MIKELSIQHYKGFYNQQIFQFAIPDGAKNGSGLTFIVGPNNTGKSTVIEALLINKTKKFTDVERHPGKKVVIKITNSTGETATYSNEVNLSTINQKGNHSIQFEPIPSRRSWQPEFSGETLFPSFLKQTFQANMRRPETFNLGPTLNVIRQNPALKKKFDELIAQVVPHFTGWGIDTNSVNQDYVKYTSKTTAHQSNLLGEGFISLFRIVAHLVHDEVSTFVIDEPELSLHPTAQKRLAEILSEVAQTKQIIICTHSPYFVSWFDFINGASIIRLNKHNDEKCTTSQLELTANYGRFINKNLNEYQKPQLLDTTAKELLFTDKILFVEGQEDIGIIRKWARDNKQILNFDMFGYGVGGHSNFKLFLKMASDLDIRKVGALYDGNATTSYTTDKLAHPDYLLQKLRTPDIRDKIEKKVVVKEGTFDSRGTLKAAQKTHFEDLMTSYTSYFSA